MDHSKMLGMAATLACLTLLTGCFDSNPEHIQAWTKPFETNVTTDRYIVQPPDELELRCAQVPEVNMQRQRVRPDGKISFEILGEFEVAGKTPEEVATAVGQRIKELYTLPGDHAVDVRVTAFNSHVYYVVGQLSRPGPRIYTGRDQLLTAIAEGQPSPLAWQKRIQVIRPAPQEGTEPYHFEINYKRMTQKGDTTKDVLLQEGDIVYVPPTVLAAIGMVLEEFISPVARAFYGAYLVQNPPGSSQGYSPYSGGYGGR
ncbi:MAG: polysaccharide biosynthesis/export family protein [Planctomycetes bacterium]|jgi:polysaccharide export outer membrane protein|nr:polysaccharide biosynthesis/export family protein [Planctomycetota bacterium]